MISSDNSLHSAGIWLEQQVVILYYQLQISHRLVIITSQAYPVSLRDNVTLNISVPMSGVHPYSLHYQIQLMHHINAKLHTCFPNYGFMHVGNVCFTIIMPILTTCKCMYHSEFFILQDDCFNYQKMKYYYFHLSSHSLKTSSPLWYTYLKQTLQSHHHCIQWLWKHPCMCTASAVVKPKSVL